MMMVVFPSEHAKQQLSLLLPPKVFFHLSFTPFHPTILLLLSCEHCVASSYPSVSRFISTYLFIFYFSSHNVLSPSSSLFGSTLPYPLILRDIGIVVVLCGTIYLQSCGDVQYVVLWTHQLVFILLVPIVSLIWQCDLSHSFTAIGSEPNQVKRKEKKETLFPLSGQSNICVFKIELSIFILNWEYLAYDILTWS